MVSDLGTGMHILLVTYVSHVQYVRVLWISNGLQDCLEHAIVIKNMQTA